MAMIMYRLGNHNDAHGHIDQTAEVVGQGAFGCVFKGVWVKPDGARQTIAMKHIQRRNLHWSKEKMRQRFQREVDMWRGMQHQHILHFLGTCERETGDELDLFLLSPLMEKGNAKQYLTGREDENRAKLLLQAASGLAHMHAKNTTHGDLKADNVLISEKGQALLADLGIASRLDDSSASSSLRAAGAIRFSAPELLSSSNPKKTFSSDVYAFGMLMFEVLTDEVPWTNLRDGNIIVEVSKGKRPPKPTTCDHEIWDIAAKCWAQDPAARPSMQEVVKLLAKYVYPRPLSSIDHVFVFPADAEELLRLRKERVSHQEQVSAAYEQLRVANGRIGQLEEQLASLKTLVAQLTELPTPNAPLSPSHTTGEVHGHTTTIGRIAKKLKHGLDHLTDANKSGAFSGKSWSNYPNIPQEPRGRRVNVNSNS